MKDEFETLDNFQITENEPQKRKRFLVRRERPTQYKPQTQDGEPQLTNAEQGLIRLNRYVANAGICSRREADDLISKGKVSVNEQVITELGYKVKKGDVVKYDGRLINREKSVYILLNKPKDYITTVDDPENRKTVMDLIQNACEERVYPVGRLDRDTTGLLLLTNDGDLAQRLAHPSFEVKKIYHVELDKRITDEDYNKLFEGVLLEDGWAKVDSAEILTAEGNTLGVEIHLGRNRIIRRMFEALGYEVVKLDRTMYAGLTKKDIGRGHWRMLSPEEVRHLKFF
ncbi:MAG: rRNA pseudouridine synthase [Bacteroidetes bacterium]|nr:MAG: rRNA pseudouridine synthase [Bacteroidota bacterium]